MASRVAANVAKPRAEGVRLFVSRLHWTVSSTCLRKHFERFGRVLFANVHLDMQTGFHKGYGWVRMSSEEEVQKVLDYKRHAIEGYEASVARDRSGDRATTPTDRMEASLPSSTDTQQTTPQPAHTL